MAVPSGRFSPGQSRPLFRSLNRVGCRVVPPAALVVQAVGVWDGDDCRREQQRHHQNISVVDVADEP